MHLSKRVNSPLNLVEALLRVLPTLVIKTSHFDFFVHELGGVLPSLLGLVMAFFGLPHVPSPSLVLHVVASLRGDFEGLHHVMSMRHAYSGLLRCGSCIGTYSPSSSSSSSFALGLREVASS